MQLEGHDKDEQQDNGEVNINFRGAIGILLFAAVNLRPHIEFAVKSTQPQKPEMR